MADFMQPEATYARRWLRVERRHDSFGPIDATDYVYERGDDVERLGKGWCARLSAPGYLDCTEWCGPCATEKEALRELAQAHDLCAHCMEADCYGSDEPADLCEAALLDSIEASAQIAASERMRGRAHNGCYLRDEIAELAKRPDRDEWRADVRRMMVRGIEAGRRSIEKELRGMVYAFTTSADGTALPWIDTPSGRIGPAELATNVRFARLRFPGLFAHQETEGAR